MILSRFSRIAFILLLRYFITRYLIKRLLVSDIVNSVILLLKQTLMFLVIAFSFYDAFVVWRDPFGNAYESEISIESHSVRISLEFIANKVRGNIIVGNAHNMTT